MFPFQLIHHSLLTLNLVCSSIYVKGARGRFGRTGGPKMFTGDPASFERVPKPVPDPKAGLQIRVGFTRIRPLRKN